MYIAPGSNKYLKAGDLQGKQVQLVISHVAAEEVGQARDQKNILYFQGKKKGVVLNSTNTKTLVAAYGNETEHWRGRPCILYGEQTQFGGQPMLGLRIRIPSGQPAAAPPPQVQQQQHQPVAANGSPITDEGGEIDPSDIAF